VIPGSWTFRTDPTVVTELLRSKRMPSGCQRLVTLTGRISHWYHYDHWFLYDDIPWTSMITIITKMTSTDMILRFSMKPITKIRTQDKQLKCYHPNSIGQVCYPSITIFQGFHDYVFRQFTSRLALGLSSQLGNFKLTDGLECSSTAQM